ncbi:unnamed protein product [Phytophthora fragariaefolia]|uniref:Unnamed protein product n=1 Tax=Phytophthora fragariaefolia TaxID=1490495 RepID=A0A9W6U4Q4_9STRA|nr:unnamed protein product [Phytophthora fragariaefolia]
MHLAQKAGEYAPILLPTVPVDKINGLDKSASPPTGRCAPVPQIQKQWFERQSSCALEVDAAAASILNPTRFESQQKAAEGTGELRNVPSLAAIWEEERLRRLQNGERGTPMISLSLERDVDGPKSLLISATPAQLASSLLSQSFFKKKMKDSIDAVMKEMENQHNEQEAKSSVPGPNESLSVGADVMSCGNSIAVESEFSYSQADHDGSSDGQTADQDIAEEDEAIVNVLLEMQQDIEPDPLDKELQGEEEHERYSVIDGVYRGDDGDNNADENIIKWASRNDEISDILASQRLVEENSERDAVESPKGNGWWNIAEREARPIASPLSQLGSPRVVYTPQRRLHKVWNLVFHSFFGLF